MNMLNMYNRRQFLILCFIHKIINYGSAPYLDDIFVKNNNNTRAGLDTTSLKVFQIKKNEKNKYVLSYCLCKMWNELPHNIRNLNSHNVFRTTLYNYLLTEQIKKN